MEEDGFEPSKAELTDLQSAPFGHLGTPPNKFPFLWCLEAESNHRHEDFQSSALPTELSRQVVGLQGLEPRTDRL